MGKIVNFIKRIKGSTASKWIVSGLSVLLCMLLIVLLLVKLPDSMALDVEYFLGTMSKEEFIQIIEWIIGGLVFGIVSLKERWGKLETAIKYLMKFVGFMKFINLIKSLDFKQIKRDGITSKQIVGSFGGLFVGLLIMFVVVIFSDCDAEWSGKLLCTDNNNHKTATIQLLGWSMGGVLTVIGLAVSSQWIGAQISNVKAQLKNNEAQLENNKAQLENNVLVEKGHKQERFNIATEHLGHENASVRIAAFYEFFYLIKDNEKEYKENILDILYAHIRAKTSDLVNHKNEENDFTVKPTEEIQGLLDMLFKSQGINHNNIKPNLQRSYLSRANLFGADLRRVNFSWASLSCADLRSADLRSANFHSADLSDADLSNANLSNANLSNAKLSNAQLGRAYYTKKTQFSELLKRQILWEIDSSDESNVKRFPQGFIVQN